MEGTASLRSELRRAALSRFLATASAARTVEITGLSPLRGGALQENWGLDARFCGGALDGEQRLVLRTSAATGVAASLTRHQEFAVQKAVFAAGVQVPEPLFASEDAAVWGKPFFIMRRVDGSPHPTGSPAIRRWIRHSPRSPSGSAANSHASTRSSRRGRTWPS